MMRLSISSALVTAAALACVGALAGCTVLSRGSLGGGMTTTGAATAGGGSATTNSGGSATAGSDGSAATGSDGATATGTGTRAPHGGAAIGETEEGHITAHYQRLPPYPAAPQDPWLAVVGDQPRRMSAAAAEVWTVRSNDFGCTAVHDHCFAPEAWLIENDDARRRTFRTARAYGFGPDGTVLPSNARDTPQPVAPYTAYRTVPATRANLRPGVLIATLGFPRTQLDRGGQVFTEIWHLGVVDRVDWDLGFVFLVGQDRTYWISATRTAVLAWRPGGRVEILDGRARDELAVRAADVIVPPPP